MTSSQFSNQFLIAMPSMEDPNFTRSVTLICEHNDEGAFGLVVNRTLDVTLGELFEHLGIDCDDPEINEATAFLGGPVETQQGFILHDTSRLWPESLVVSDYLAMTASKDILIAIAAHEGPDHFLVTMGYAGWTAGQLEQEMANNVWLNHPASPDIVFDIPIDDRWHTAAQRMGIDLSLLSSESGRA